MDHYENQRAADERILNIHPLPENMYSICSALPEYVMLPDGRELKVQEWRRKSGGRLLAKVELYGMTRYLEHSEIFFQTFLKPRGIKNERRT